MTNQLKIVVIGGGAGGATAVAKLRRLNEHCQITLVEKSPYISYASCGMPYHVGGVIPDRDELFVLEPETFVNKFNVNLMTEHRAFSIDRNAKTVTAICEVSGAKTDLEYDKLLLAPGSTPFIPPVKGIEQIESYTLNNIPQMDRLIEGIEDKKRVAVIGSGFIGIELAENLVKRGKQVFVIEILNQVFPLLDKEMANIVHRELLEKGISVLLNTGIESVSKNQNEITLHFKGEPPLQVDALVFTS